MPELLKGLIAKHYLFDARCTPDSDEYKAFFAMEDYLKSLGLRTASERLFGIVGLRNAAEKAGLGVIRNNNFFYTESGSWVNLLAWLTDCERTLIHTPALPPCPENCLLCVRACPTKALSSPHTMSPHDCVSFMTNRTTVDCMSTDHRKKLGRCLYGCDVCQEACPYNHGKWRDEENFPGVSELALYLTPEAVMQMDEDFTVGAYSQNSSTWLPTSCGNGRSTRSISCVTIMRKNTRHSF
jgi:epoxyqueuosine reductase